MRVMVLGLLLFATAAMSAPTSEVQSMPNHHLSFELIQDRFIFDNTTVEKASLMNKADGSFRGILIVLKKPATEAMRRFSTFGVGKEISLVFDGNIVTVMKVKSVFGNKLLITGLTREAAQEYIDTLKAHDPKYMKQRATVTQKA